MDWSDRYKTPLAKVFSRQHKLELEWRVEISLLKSLAKLHLIPAEASVEAEAAVASGRVTLARTLEIEEETQHDIMAMAKAISEQCPNYGGFIHYGATSQDINDTVLALQLSEARTTLLNATDDVRTALYSLSSRYRSLPCIGRTHGQHAIPITVGHKFANYLHEMSLAREHLARVPIVGKFSGAVGSYASLGRRDIESLLLSDLNLPAVPVSTQVISRLYLSDYTFGIVSLVSACERIAKEIRNLQRSEIAEWSEGFSAHQVGSSTMPQKRNPHKSERICGLARVVRAQLAAMTESVALEHERDLTNSSVERIALPTAICLGHFILLEMKKILHNLHVNEENVRKNLFAQGGKQLAERIMMAVANKVGRQEAHEILRLHTKQEDFVGALKADERITKVLGAEELDKLLDPTTYIGLTPLVVDDILKLYEDVKPKSGAGKDEQKRAASLSSTASTASTASSTSSVSSSITYRDAGVDIDAGDSLVEVIKPACRSTRRIGCDAELGGFGALFDLKALDYKNPILVSSTDGVGTKLFIAKAANKHDTIGQDLVAMSVNDVIVQGAEPLFFLDYFATSKLNVKEAAQVVQGIAKACKESNCALIGGETAEMPGLYAPGDYDLAGFVVGAVEKDNLLPKLQEIAEGDVCLGLLSSGVHSNGFSLVRKVIAQRNIDWFLPPPYPSHALRLCDDLLTPTRLYISMFVPLLRAANSSGIRAMAHITGGGLPDNLPRVIPSHLQAVLDIEQWAKEMPAVFGWLNKQGVPANEMLRTFNCGIGMVVVVKKDQEKEVTDKLRVAGETVIRMGELRKKNTATDPEVLVKNVEKVFV